MKNSVVVCGGSKGIGAALSRILIQKGTRVICLSRSLGELGSEFSSSDFFRHIPCDLSSPKSRKEAIAQLELEANISGLVNNASGPATGPMVETETREYETAFETHLFSAQDFVKCVLPKFQKTGSGRIVNIISVTAKIPLENMVVSNTLRGAMLNWSKTLSKELGRSQITVNNILPGYTETERLYEVIKGVSKKQQTSEETFKKKLIDQIPLGRFARPDEIGAVAAFLLSKEASYINGVSIPVDGGWTPCA